MAHDDKFRFGVQVSQTASASAWRDKARKIEDLGYSTLVHARPLRRGARAAARDRDGGRAHDDVAHRLARVRQRLQAPGDPGQGSGDDRPALRRPLRARHRRGLDEDRLRRARAPVRPARGARRPVRGGAARHQAVLHRRAVQHARRALPHHGLRVVADAGAEAGPADPDRRRRQARARRSPGARPTSSASTRTCAPARSTRTRRATR